MNNHFITFKHKGFPVLVPFNVIELITCDNEMCKIEIQGNRKFTTFYYVSKKTDPSGFNEMFKLCSGNSQ